METEFNFSSRRSAVLCRNGCVASTSPLASQAGLDILKAGGNAADAAVAVAAVLNVVEPMSTGIGGDAFCLFYNSSTKKLSGINGSGRCPQALTLERLASDGFNKTNFRPQNHGHNVTVPGAASCWVDTIEQHGSGKLSLSEILNPAIVVAEEGFPVPDIASYFWAKGAWLLKTPTNTHGNELLLNGEAPQYGDVMRNPCLASVFKDLAKHGKSGFYSGRIAKSVVEAVKQHGGVMTAGDLASHTSTKVEPIFADYKGCRLWELPPNGQGMAALLALNILEGFDLKSMGHNSAAYIHHLIESFRIAFADTLKHCSDPEHGSIPLDRLLSKEYAAQCRAKIQPDRVIPSSELVAGDLEVPPGASTVYFSVTDNEGNACSFINSNFTGFGTGIVPQGCGFTLQNRGLSFSMDPNHKNVLAPGKRPYHTIIPAMLTSAETNDLLMCYGVMGAYMQPQGHVQVLLNMLEFGLDPQASLDTLRFSLKQDHKKCVTEPLALLDAIWVEEGIPDSVVDQLRSIGHTVEVLSGHDRSMFGRGQAIAQGSEWWRKGAHHSKERVYWAGSDPRGDGLVASY